MARTVIPITTIVLAGVTEPAVVMGNVTDGHIVSPNDGRVWIEVENTDSSSHTVTFITGFVSPSGFSLEDDVQTIPANTRKRFGSFPTGDFNQPSTQTQDLWINCNSALIAFRAWTLPA